MLTAAENIVDCVRAASRLPFDAGMRFERERFLVCNASPAAKALARGLGRGATLHAGFTVGLAASIVLIGVTFGMQPPAAPPRGEEPKPLVEAKPEVSRGRVLDGNGKPVKGAAVYWLGHSNSRRTLL